MFGFDTRQIRPRGPLDTTTGCAVEEMASYRLSGFTVGTRLATPHGWRPVEAITVGDAVMSFDNGMKVVQAVTRGTQYAAAGDLPAFAVPIHVPIGAIGNEEPLGLLPEQNVMLESDAAEALTGDPFALVPAKALDGFRGIDRSRDLRPVEAISLHFRDDEVVFADGGALLHAPNAVPGIIALNELDRIASHPSPYRVLRGPGARALIAAMAEEDARVFGERHACAA